MVQILSFNKDFAIKVVFNIPAYIVIFALKFNWILTILLKVIIKLLFHYSQFKQNAL